MARSLYGRLTRRYQPQSTALDRREFLKIAMAASAGLLLSGGVGFARSGSFRGVGRGRKVIVIGAGFGGLACAYELISAGYDVIVLEARKRVGRSCPEFQRHDSGKSCGRRGRVDRFKPPDVGRLREEVWAFVQRRDRG